MLGYLLTFITLGLLLLFILSIINLVFSLLKSLLCTFLLEKVGLYIALIFTIIITVYFPTNLIRLFSFLFGKSSNYKRQIMHILDLLTKVLRPRILIYVISSIIAISHHSKPWSRYIDIYQINWNRFQCRFRSCSYISYIRCTNSTVKG